ncbi:MAG: lytic murein transglycosylase B [Burkholderiaceae bacterium]|nr:lytic murein transglycosylase B [Burkholderiaceae bacterium]
MPLRFALICSACMALLLGACTTPATAKKPPAPPPYDTRAEVQAFAAQMAARHGWDARWVLLQLRGAQLQRSTQKLMMPAPPGQAKNWAAYRDRFVEPQRIAAGTAFWQANADALARAEARYGVPAEVIVGIVGVETFYGRVLGRYRALDVLATLAFDFPSGRSDRSGYFRDELEQLLVLARHEDVDPASLTGSFAGAIGLPQFMPGSINRHAVDFDGDGHIDLTTSAADAIGSIAHFLAQHGWRPGMPVTFDVTPPDDPAQRARLLAPDIVPSFDAATFAAAGATLSPAGQAHDGLMALVSVDNGDAPPSFVAGTVNFFVLTRYNRSSYYARAVLALGEAVRSAR